MEEEGDYAEGNLEDSLLHPVKNCYHSARNPYALQSGTGKAASLVGGVGTDKG